MYCFPISVTTIFRWSALPLANGEFSSFSYYLPRWVLQIYLLLLYLASKSCIDLRAGEMEHDMEAAKRELEAKFADLRRMHERALETTGRLVAELEASHSELLEETEPRNFLARYPRLRLTVDFASGQLVFLRCQLAPFLRVKDGAEGRVPAPRLKEGQVIEMRFADGASPRDFWLRIPGVTPTDKDLISHLVRPEKPPRSGDHVLLYDGEPPALRAEAMAGGSFRDLDTGRIAKPDPESVWKLPQIASEIEARAVHCRLAQLPGPADVWERDLPDFRKTLDGAVLTVQILGRDEESNVWLVDVEAFVAETEARFSLRDYLAKHVLPTLQTPDSVTGLRRGERTMQGRITHVATPEDIYLQHEPAASALARGMRKRYPFGSGDGLAAGDRCAVTTPGGEWRRALVTSATTDGVLAVRFLDSGESGEVTRSAACQLRNCDLVLPPLATKCRLAGVLPRGGCTLWPLEAGVALSVLLPRGTLCVAKVLDEFSVSVQLYVDGATLSINLQLVRVGGAELLSPPHLVLPSVGSEVKLQVLHVSGLDTFHVALEFEQLAELEERLNSGPPPPPLLDLPEVGKLVLAKYSLDGRWYRARLLSLAPQVQVRFLDYGNVESVCLNQIADVEPEFLQLPFQVRSVDHLFAKCLLNRTYSPLFQAMECYLTNVMLNYKVDDEQRKAINEFFKQMVLEEVCSARVICNSAPMGVELLDVNGRDIGEFVAARFPGLVRIR